MAFGTCFVCGSIGKLTQKYIKYKSTGLSVKRYGTSLPVVAYKDTLMCDNNSCYDTSMFEEVSKEEFYKYIELSKIL